MRCARSIPVHKSHYSRLGKPTIPLATQKTTTYISHVVSTTTHTQNRRKSIGKKKQRTKKRKERNWVHGAKKKKRKINFGGSTGEAATRTGCHMSRGLSTVYSSSTTNDFRYTHRSTDYRPITRSTAGRGCHVSLCWGPRGSGLCCLDCN